MLPQSFFIDTAKVHEREIVLASGKHACWFREISQDQMTAWGDSRKAEASAERRKGDAELLVAGVCEPDGAPALTLEQALALKPAVLMELVNKLLQVNEYRAGNA